MLTVSILFPFFFWLLALEKILVFHLEAAYFEHGKFTYFKLVPLQVLKRCLYVWVHYLFTKAASVIRSLRTPHT